MNVSVVSQAVGLVSSHKLYLAHPYLMRNTLNNGLHSDAQQPNIVTLGIIIYTTELYSLIRM